MSTAAQGGAWSHSPFEAVRRALRKADERAREAQAEFERAEAELERDPSPLAFDIVDAFAKRLERAQHELMRALADYVRHCGSQP